MSKPELKEPLINQYPLKRSLTTWFTFAYGVGTMLGAGIYVLVGKVAGYAGLLAPLSFIFAAIVALFSALSYAELTSRLPKAAGEAVYTQAAFRNRFLSGLVGWAVVITGVVSAAVLAKGFVGYATYFLQLPNWLLLTGFILVIGLIAAWGIQQSVMIATVITIIEVAGLLLVVGVASTQLAELPAFKLPEGGSWGGIFLGAFLAFYAFIGFEDMVNLAEEVKNPRRSLPLALLLALGTVTLLYVLVSLATVLVIPQEELITTDAPFTLLFEQQGIAPAIITVISLIAIINGCLIQIIMAARVLYGMGKQGTAPQLFARVHPKRHTPLIPTALATLTILILALLFPIVPLAEVTSFVILFVFAFVNLSLFVLKRREPSPPIKIVRIPSFVPLVGLFLSVGMLIFRLVIEVKN